MLKIFPYSASRYRLNRRSATTLQAYELIHSLTEQQVEDLHRLYQNEWWSKDRGLDDIRRMLLNTDIVIGFCEPETKKLVAFTRILTDYVYKALIMDVIVAGPCRNQGLGLRLLDTVMQHPDLSSVQQFELYCKENMVPFYKRWGFQDELGDIRFMRKKAST